PCSTGNVGGEHAGCAWVKISYNARRSCSASGETISRSLASSAIPDAERFGKKASSIALKSQARMSSGGSQRAGVYRSGGPRRRDNDPPPVAGCPPLPPTAHGHLRSGLPLGHPIHRPGGARTL